MRVLVTGASGFIGGHVVRYLQEKTSCDVIATGRDEKRLRRLGASFVVLDLHRVGPDCYELLGRPDVLIHLAWDGLPAYREPIHIDRNLWDSYRFLHWMIDRGLARLSCVGTCYEYGLQEGCLAEDRPAAPVTAYGVAKDTLRRFLECLQETRSFQMCWLRLFFIHGEGQHPHALLAQLDHAIASGADSFDMSGGEQLRDYLEVTAVAEAIVKATLQSKVDGIFNICSGVPISIRSLVEHRILEHGSFIRPRLGVYPYPDYEPMAFWGDASRLHQAMAAFDEEGFRAG